MRDYCLRYRGKRDIRSFHYVVSASTVNVHI